MNFKVYNSIVNQFMILINNRNYDPQSFYFSANGSDKIHVYDKYNLRFIIDVNDFTSKQVLDPGFKEWALYKTRTLNKALTTIAFAADTLCIDWQGLNKGDTGGLEIGSDPIDTYLANSSLWDGVTMTVKVSDQGVDSFNNPLKLMIFDSNDPAPDLNNPLVGDPDLKTPITDPSKVAGGIDPNKNHGNLLIVSENNNSSIPDDRAAPSNVTFTFSESVVLKSLEFIDSDEPDNDVDNTHSITLYDGPDGTGTNIGRLFISKLGDNSAEKLTIDKSDVRSFVFRFVGSGAISDICFQRQSTLGFAYTDSGSSCFQVDGYNGWSNSFNKSTSFDETFNLYIGPESCNDFNNQIGTAHMFYNTPTNEMLVDIILNNGVNYKLVESCIYIESSSVPSTGPAIYTHDSNPGSPTFDLIGESTEKEHYYNIDYASIANEFYLVVKVKVLKIIN